MILLALTHMIYDIHASLLEIDELSFQSVNMSRGVFIYCQWRLHV